MEADAEPGPRLYLTAWLDQHDRSSMRCARRDGDLVAHQDITRHACLDFIFHASRFGCDRGFDLQPTTESAETTSSSNTLGRGSGSSTVP